MKQRCLKGWPPKCFYTPIEKTPGLYKDAIDAFKQSIRIEPDYADAYLILGIAYAKSGMYKEAVEASKQAIRINPDYAEAHYGLGIYYILSKDRDSALEEYKILKDLDPELANKLFNMIDPQTTAEGAGWELIAESSNGNRTYIYKASAKKVSKNVVRAWLKFVYHKPKEINSKQAKYYLSYEEWDCIEEKYRILEYSFYFTDGNNETKVKQDAKWSFIRPDTVEEAIFKYLCKNGK